MSEARPLPRIVPFGLYMGFVVLADLLQRAGVSALLLLWLYPLKIGAVVAALWYWRRSYTELRGAPLTLAQAGWAVLAGVLVLVLWIELDTSWMWVGSPAGYNPTLGGAIDWPLVVLRIAGAALVVPVMEELFWRSFLLRWLQAPAFATVAPAEVGYRALAISSVLFAIEHTQWLAGLIAGLVYALLYMRIRNLWAAVLAHAVTNGLLGVWIIVTKNWTYW